MDEATATMVRTADPSGGEGVEPARRNFPATKIEATGVGVFYGEKEALRNVDIDIPEHQVTALIGPSGCGKSTFLRCLNRMNDVIESCRVVGRMTLDGEDIYDPSLDVVLLRARVGMVFQKPNPFPKSIYDNVAYGPRIHGTAANRAELDDIVHSSLDRAGLLEEVKDRIDEPGTGLSGGQQQRLCIARAIAISPEVILMDEPCSALDPIATARIEELIDELRAELHDRHRHPFDAAGGPGIAEDRVLPSRQPGRGGQHRADLHQPQRRAHARLYHRPVRLGARGGASGRTQTGMEGRTHRQVL